MAEPTREANWKVYGTLDGSGEVDVMDGDRYIVTCYGPQARQNATAIVEGRWTVEVLRRALVDLKDLLPLYVMNITGTAYRESLAKTVIDAALASPPVEQVRLEWERLKADSAAYHDLLSIDENDPIAQFTASEHSPDCGTFTEAATCELGPMVSINLWKAETARADRAEKMAEILAGKVSEALDVIDRDLKLRMAAEAEVARLKAERP